MMEDPLLTPAKYQRGTIDSRDTFTTRLYRMLGMFYMYIANIYLATKETPQIEN